VANLAMVYQTLRSTVARSPPLVLPNKTGIPFPCFLSL
jgi:hypothetical protein